MATGSGSSSEEGRLRVVRGRAVAVRTGDHAGRGVRAGTPPCAQYDGPDGVRQGLDDNGHQTEGVTAGRPESRLPAGPRQPWT
ncbi:hypothetical protein, partial [Streptomyces cahuitamycinicus]|uniref:hypothetical protein n=1 Tax=Streptomyces cahuitamycinicus TaxID=2070367 RepID=UPI001CA52F8A